MSFQNINFLGHIPYNPDLLLNKNRAANRPVGFLYTDLINMYWTARSFKVDIDIVTVALQDALTSFLNAGGGIGGVVGAGLALGAVNADTAGSISMHGYSQIVTKYEKAIRKSKTSSIPSDGMWGFPQDLGEDWWELDEDIVEEDERVDQNPLISTNNRPDEGSLCSAGPRHKFRSGINYLEVDFSDILYRNGKYWPRIIFFANSGTATYASSPLLTEGGAGALTINGSITIMGYPMKVYGTISFDPAVIIPPFANLSGKVRIGKRCGDQFYYDGGDEARVEDDECPQLIKGDPNSVYPPDRAGSKPT